MGSDQLDKGLRAEAGERQDAVIADDWRHVDQT
jgi:hypothetical protein